MSMPNLRRLLLVSALVVGVLSVVLPALAVETIVLATAEEQTVEEAPVIAPVNAPEPAVRIDTSPGDEPVPEWTFRYLLPTTLVLGGLAVVATIVAYFVKVTKARYRVVE